MHYDDKAVALTPRSVRAFNRAAEAILAGKPVRLPTDGCGTGAGFSMGAGCGERLHGLEAVLEKNGIRNAQRLFAGAP